MAVTLTDDEIDALVRERKVFPRKWLKLVSRLKRDGAHYRQEVKLRSESGTEFQVKVRLSVRNPQDFCIVLATKSRLLSRLFRLRRYEGRGEHTNHIEGERFDGFHIHIATARYQERGREDAYAELTTRYDDFLGALDCLIKDTRIHLPTGAPRSLFLEDRSCPSTP